MDTPGNVQESTPRKGNEWKHGENTSICNLEDLPASLVLPALKRPHDTLEHETAYLRPGDGPAHGFLRDGSVLDIESHTLQPLRPSVGQERGAHDEVPPNRRGVLGDGLDGEIFHGLLVLVRLVDHGVDRLEEDGDVAAVSADAHRGDHDQRGLDEGRAGAQDGEDGGDGVAAERGVFLSGEQVARLADGVAADAGDDDVDGVVALGVGRVEDGGEERLGHDGRVFHVADDNGEILGDEGGGDAMCGFEEGGEFAGVSDDCWALVSDYILEGREVELTGCACISRLQAVC